MSLSHEDLRALAKLGAEKRLRQLESEIAERQALADAIRKEFGFSRNGQDDEEEEDPKADWLTRAELKSEIQRILSAAHGAPMDTHAIAKAIEAHRGKPIGGRAALRVAIMCGKMASVRRDASDRGWVWN